MDLIYPFFYKLFSAKFGFVLELIMTNIMCGMIFWWIFGTKIVENELFLKFFMAQWVSWSNLFWAFSICFDTVNLLGFERGAKALLDRRKKPTVRREFFGLSFGFKSNPGWAFRLRIITKTTIILCGQWSYDVSYEMRPSMLKRSKQHVVFA